MLWVSTEPGLHGFADGAQLVQGRRVQLRPAKVLDLGGGCRSETGNGSKQGQDTGVWDKVSLLAVHNDSLNVFFTCTVG